MPSEQHPLVINRSPILPRIKFEERVFGFLGCIRRGSYQLQLVRDTEHVLIHRNALHNAEGFIEHSVGSFAPYAG